MPIIFSHHAGICRYNVKLCISLQQCVANVFFFLCGIIGRFFVSTLSIFFPTLFPHFIVERRRPLEVTFLVCVNFAQSFLL